MQGLLIVLVPLLIGYLMKVKHPQRLKPIGFILTLCLYAILFIVGFDLGQLDNLAKQLPQIGFSACVFIFCILICNLLCLIAYDKYRPSPVQIASQAMPSRLKLICDSAKLCAMVILGFLFGNLCAEVFSLPNHTSYYVLVLMIFLVGLQLRNSGISMKQVLLNRRGLITGAIMIGSSLLGGFLAAKWLNLPIEKGLALASSLGWYSLSSVVLNDAWGPIYGSIAFFNDLARELFSLFLIPLLMRNYRSTAIGIAGATAIDCTLPIIQRAGGINVVPLAISFGFITNILPPILLVIFTAM